MALSMTLGEALGMALSATLSTAPGEPLSTTLSTTLKKPFGASLQVTLSTSCDYLVLKYHTVVQITPIGRTLVGTHLCDTQFRTRLPKTGRTRFLGNIAIRQKIQPLI